MNQLTTIKKQINQTGFAHHLVLTAFVLLFAIGGVYMLVAGRAQAPSYDNLLHTDIVSDCTLKGNETVETLSDGKWQKRQDVPYYQTLKKGDSNKCVKSLQNLLNYRCSTMGQSAKLSLTGKFDSKTQNALLAFQKSMTGVSKIDKSEFGDRGIVGAQTWAALQVLDPAKAGQLNCS